MEILWCPILKFLTEVFWNPVIVILNFIMGIVVNPIGFIWWIVSSLLGLFAAVLPSTPAQLTLQNAVNNIGQTTGLGTTLIAEIMGTVSQILVIVAVIKVYKLLPGKMT